MSYVHIPLDIRIYCKNSKWPLNNVCATGNEDITVPDVKPILGKTTRTHAQIESAFAYTYWVANKYIVSVTMATSCALSIFLSIESIAKCQQMTVSISIRIHRNFCCRQKLSQNSFRPKYTRAPHCVCSISYCTATESIRFHIYVTCTETCSSDRRSCICMCTCVYAHVLCCICDIQLKSILQTNCHLNNWFFSLINFAFDLS